MQASKIKVSEEYAISRTHREDIPGEGPKVSNVLVRFRVTSVTTTRTKGYTSREEYHSTVTGVIDEQDAKAYGIPEAERKLQGVKPEAILGPYREFAALKEREAAERAVRQAEGEAQKKTARELYELLYRVTGLPVPAGTRSWDHPFYLSSGGASIDIRYNGVTTLLAALRRLTPASGNVVPLRAVTGDRSE